MRAFVLRGLVALLCLAPFTCAASAAEMTWRMRSLYRYTAQVQMFSSTRRGHVWPEAGMAWDLNDSDWHDLNISCRAGEKICFGAWDTGNPNAAYWGVGQSINNACEKCCHTCVDGSVVVHTLQP